MRNSIVILLALWGTISNQNKIITYENGLEAELFYLLMPTHGKDYISKVEATDDEIIITHSNSSKAKINKKDILRRKIKVIFNKFSLKLDFFTNDLP